VRRESLVDVPESRRRLVSTRSSLHNTRSSVSLSLLELLVLANVQESEKKRKPGHDKTHDGVGASTRDIPGSRGCRVHVRSVDGRRVADHVGDGNAGGSLDKRTGERVGDP
jgi:hypothetical protein